MSSIVYRDLPVDEAQRIETIDRSESIDGFYRATKGVLELEAAQEQSPTWTGAWLADYVARLQALIRAGGSAFAAWDGQRLVGFGSLDVSGVGGDRAVLRLDMLYVSAGYRGRGIGRVLTEMAANRAASLGATSLYISATPTRGTVDAYLRMGAHLLAEPDPELFAREPEDIHLALRLPRRPERT